MPQYFTRDEAEALLPRLVPLLHRLRDLHEELRQLQAQLEALQIRMRGNGHAHQGELAHLRQTAAKTVEDINQHVRHINEWGVLVKDLETGLVDFPSLREGQEVYLCWRLGEAHVSWWHPIEGGFAGRQPLDE